MELSGGAERELVRRCRAGKSRSYEPLVRAYEAPALRVATGLLGNREDARDAVQDAFVRAYRALDDFDAERRFGPWFFRILRNRCRDVLRRRAGHRERSSAPEHLPQEAPARRAFRRERERRSAREAVWDALERVSEPHREVVVLRDLEGCSYREIAQILDIPEGTVASRLYHARSALRDELRAMGVTHP